MAKTSHPGSFRDPSGALFTDNGVLLREVRLCYKEQYDCLNASGLYARLIEGGLLVSHEEQKLAENADPDVVAVIKPLSIPFVSYPYEWCFSQLKDAALLTLQVQKLALEHGMILKDASAYNVQFYRGKSIFIDTLSFEKYREKCPWIAYKQFCEHFLAPLALMRYVDPRMNLLLRVFLDGIPLDFACKQLPFMCRFSIPLLVHLFAHARSQKHFAGASLSEYKARSNMTKSSMMGLVESLESAVAHLKLPGQSSAWSDYYGDSSYSDAALSHKQEIVAAFLAETRPKTLWDLGSNTGLFSRIALNAGIEVVAFDSDPVVVEKNYREYAGKNAGNILPLVMNLCNPSPGIGWENSERSSLVARGPADMALCLALVHHLAISNNLPFSMIAAFFSKICRMLIIEFVPREDSQVQRLLESRDDPFAQYTQEGFERAFEACFIISRKCQLMESSRTVYLMEKRPAR